MIQAPRIMPIETNDVYEPYLEPLFIPGFFGVILYVVVYSFIGAIWYGHLPIEILYLISVLDLMISTVLVLIYEFLLYARLLKPRAIVKQPEGTYKILRWFLGLVGLISICYSLYAVLFILISLSNYKAPTEGPYDNSITLEN